MNLEDQLKREAIPDPSTIKSLYRPLQNLVLIKMLPDIQQIGKIIVPENSSIRMDACEGHIMMRGPAVSDNIGVGDCVVFEKQLAIGIDVDSEGTYYLIREPNVLLGAKKAELEKSAAKRRKRREVKIE